MKHGDLVVAGKSSLLSGALGIFDEQKGDYVIIWSYWENQGWSYFPFKFVEWTKLSGCYEHLTWDEKKELIKVLNRLK